VTPDDERLARSSRALRRELGLRQQDLVERGRSIYLTHIIESGRAGTLPLNEIRGHFAALGATVRMTAWWNGAALDRLLDSRHAAIVETVVRLLGQMRWTPRAEVSFSEYGERGSIDVFAARPDRRAVFVGEAKSEWGSIEETLRVHDVKTRLAGKVCHDTFGFWPTSVGSALIFPDDSTARRVVATHRETVDASYPARSREVRAWLRAPTGPLRGVWFLSNPG
jgi:hypothetical protein